jgi:uncharacterized membrane protein
MFGGKLGAPEVLIFLMGLVVVLIPWYKIFSKAGYHSGWGMSLAMLVPVVNVVLFFWFAFTTWPIEQKLGSAQSSGSGQPQP